MNDYHLQDQKDYETEFGILGLSMFCFLQVEGVIADVNLSLGELIGTFSEFFKKLGITQLEFKPAYNPYTEPSMEIFCFHPGLKRWIEVSSTDFCTNCFPLNSI